MDENKFFGNAGPPQARVREEISPKVSANFDKRPDQTQLKSSEEKKTTRPDTTGKTDHIRKIEMRYTPYYDIIKQYDTGFVDRYDSNNVDVTLSNLPSSGKQITESDLPYSHLLEESGKSDELIITQTLSKIIQAARHKDISFKLFQGMEEIHRVEQEVFGHSDVIEEYPQDDEDSKGLGIAIQLVEEFDVGMFQGVKEIVLTLLGGLQDVAVNALLQTIHLKCIRNGLYSLLQSDLKLLTCLLINNDLLQMISKRITFSVEGSAVMTWFTKGLIHFNVFHEVSYYGGTAGDHCKPNFIKGISKPTESVTGAGTNRAEIMKSKSKSLSSVNDISHLQQRNSPTRCL